MTATSAATCRRHYRWRWIALIVGLLALAPCAVAGFTSPASFLRAYLVAWLLVWGLALGSLALVMIHHLTGGAWGLVVRRALEAQMQTLPLLALLFLPMAIGRSYLFPWSDRATPAADDMPFYTFYVQPQFLWGRAFIYFALWIALSWLLTAWSREEDSRGGARLAWKSHALSGPGLLIYGVTLHFAAIDWMMSLEPAFTSTIFGPIVAAGQVLSSFAFALLVLGLTSIHPEHRRVLSSDVLLDLGNLLFTFVVVWAYLLWCQFMLIWMGDLPRDNTWLLARSGVGWQRMAVAIAILHFALPFVLLLFRRIKRNIRALTLIAALVLVMQLVFITYQIAPSLPPASSTVYWMDLLTPLGLGAIWLATFLWLYERRSIWPLHDRNWPKAMHLLRLEDVRMSEEEAFANG